MSEQLWKLTIDGEDMIVGTSVYEKLYKQEEDFEFNGLIKYENDDTSVYRRVKYKLGTNFTIIKKEYDGLV